jgi:hypothetical protein
MNKTAAELMNIELLGLYQAHYPVLTQELIPRNKQLEEEDKETSTCPLLLTVNDAYTAADWKIMFFGQETNGWCSASFDSQLLPILEEYNRFYWGEDYYNGTNYTPFWRGFDLFREKLKERFPKRNISLLWNNIVKIGLNVPGFPYDINDITERYFNIIAEEVAITKPDVLVFFSGPTPNYNRIENAFGSYNKEPVEQFAERQLCRVKNELMPKA